MAIWQKLFGEADKTYQDFGFELLKISRPKGATSEGSAQERAMQVLSSGANSRSNSRHSGEEFPSCQVLGVQLENSGFPLGFSVPWCMFHSAFSCSDKDHDQRQLREERVHLAYNPQVTHCQGRNSKQELKKRRRLSANESLSQLQDDLWPHGGNYYVANSRKLSRLGVDHEPKSMASELNATGCVLLRKDTWSRT